MQAGQAIVEVNHGAGLAFFTPYRRTRVVVIGLARLPAVVFTSLLLQELLLVLEFLLAEKSGISISE